MKTIITMVSAAFLVSAIGFSADAATKKTSEMVKQEKTCKAEAAKKFTAVHFLKRRAYVKNCMGNTKT